MTKRGISINHSIEFYDSSEHMSTDIYVFSLWHADFKRSLVLLFTLALRNKILIIIKFFSLRSILRTFVLKKWNFEDFFRLIVIHFVFFSSKIGSKKDEKKWLIFCRPFVEHYLQSLLQGFWHDITRSLRAQNRSFRPLWRSSLFLNETVEPSSIIVELRSFGSVSQQSVIRVDKEVDPRALSRSRTFTEDRNWGSVLPEFLFRVNNLFLKST